MNTEKQPTELLSESIQVAKDPKSLARLLAQVASLLDPDLMVLSRKAALEILATQHQDARAAFYAESGQVVPRWENTLETDRAVMRQWVCEMVGGYTAVNYPSAMEPAYRFFRALFYHR